MSLAWDSGYRRVVVETDSELAFKILTDPDQDCNSLNSLALNCRQIIQRKWEILILKVFREENKVTDGLLPGSFISIEMSIYSLDYPWKFEG